MLNDSAVVRLLKPWSFKRGSGLTTCECPVGGGRGAIMRHPPWKGGGGGPVCRRSGNGLLLDHACHRLPPVVAAPHPSAPDESAGPRCGHHRPLPRLLPPPALPAAHRGVPSGRSRR